MKRPASAHGIVTKHARSCRSRAGGGCNCRPTYQAWVYSARDDRKVYRSFATMAEARAWRRDTQAAVGSGRVRAAEPLLIRDAAELLLAGMRDGSIVNRSGDSYKPSVTRSYEQALRLHVLPDLGARTLGDVTTGDLQALAEKLRRRRDPQTGRLLNPSTVRNAFLPLRVLYRRAILLGQVAVNPTTGIQLAAVRGVRDRIVDPVEAAAMLAALRDADRPIWATAFYAGLRLGELRALSWADVDFARGVIRIERSWDAKEGFVAPKSTSGVRIVPLPRLLNDYLLEQRAAVPWRDGLVFGRTPAAPLNVSVLYRRAEAAWRAAGFEPITLHVARHTFASLMIAAGVNAKELSSYMGHASITITLDRYGHLFPGSHGAAASLLDAYLARADSAARIAQLDL